MTTEADGLSVQTTKNVNPFTNITASSIEDSVATSTATVVHTLDKIRGQSGTARSRVGSRAKTFIWGQEAPRKSSKTSQTASFSKDDQSVKVELDKPIDGTVDEYSAVNFETLILAATLVNDAKFGRHYDVIENQNSLKLYMLFNSRWLRCLFYTTLILNLGLALCERPSQEPLSLPYWSTQPIEIATLFLFLFRFAHLHSFTDRKKFWSDAKNIVVLATIALTFLDIIIFMIMIKSELKMGIRWSRALRPLFIINFSETRQVRRAFRNIRKTLPEVSNVLFLFFINILIFTLVALKLFGKANLRYPDGSPYFNDFVDSFFDLYVLVTTSNNPDVMMPAFDKSRWYVIFFTAFLLICLFIFMSVVLAVVYHNYKKHLKAEVKDSLVAKRVKLNRAFDLLKVEIDGKMVLTRARFSELLRNVPPKRSKILISILWFVLDEHMNNYIERQDFLKLADLLNVEVSEIQDRKILLDRMCPRFYNSIPSTFLRVCIQHRFFRYIFDLLIVLNALFIILAIELADWIFLGLFVFELLLKLYALGFRNFFSQFWNIFDFLVIGAAAVTTLIAQLSNVAEDETPTLDALLVLRVLRLVKIVARIGRFRVIVETLMHIIPFILVYGGVMFVFYYFFAIIGMELFHGLISYHGYENNIAPENLFCGNPKLEGSEFYRARYCNNNFNSILNAMVVLFELTVVNQWHVIAAGYVAVTNKWARLYFLIFHLCCVIIVLNIFTALVLEAFLLEYTFSKDTMENAMESKIQQLGLGIDKNHPDPWVSYTDGTGNEQLVANEHVPPKRSDDDDQLPDLSRDTDIRFHLSKSVKDVEVLLQRMFESEIEENVNQSIDLP